VVRVVARVRVAWQNWPGAPGVSTFYADETITQAAIDSLRAFFNGCGALLPTGLTIQVPSSGDIIDQGTGSLTGAWSVATTPTVVTGSGGTGVYAGNAGAVIHWLTPDLFGGRRLRGRSFLVPLIGTAYENNGSLSSATISAISGAATTFLAAVPGMWNVWHRPRPGFAGGNGTIESFRVPDLAVSLRSRRV
jgi:hypothetical protein